MYVLFLFEKNTVTFRESVRVQASKCKAYIPGGTGGACTRNYSKNILDLNATVLNNC